MEKISNCPNCQFDQLLPFLECIDFTVTKEKFSIKACGQCGFKVTSPRPALTEIGRYYDSADYVSHSNTTKGLINKLYHIVKKRAIAQKIRLIETLHPSTKEILDIGCGTGAFLNEIRKCGWTVTGIEPDLKTREFCRQTLNLNVFEESHLSEIPAESYSIITMWHVLEHVHSLENRIADLYRLLKKGGYAIIAVPNYLSFDANYYKEFWAAYDVPRHLYHFSPDIIKNLFKQKQFTHLKSLPMKMDAFYVSMLSEKYKNSTFQIPRAIFSGLRSNLHAGNNAELYSSVIYIFRK
jgi:2-polyprenyl-3-methyl-5-hydroxy-6-metoxy-1,4-benzoquinol methylase